jgi:hypothetical protein
MIWHVDCSERTNHGPGAFLILFIAHPVSGEGRSAEDE